MTGNCDQARELVSARLDGEASADESQLLDEHLAGCPACRAFADGAETLHAHVRLAPAPRVPDLTDAVLAATASVAEPQRGRDALRITLVAIGLVQILIAIPALLSGQEDVAAAHAQHLSSFDLALGIGLIWVAWRPSRAGAGFLPVATVLVIACLALTASDVAHGHNHTVRYLNHALGIAGLVAAFMLRDRPQPTIEPARQLAA